MRSTLDPASPRSAGCELCPGDRPNHVSIVVQRHIRAGRIQERGGKLYAISTGAE
jgi:hypothetical protein